MNQPKYTVEKVAALVSLAVLVVGWAISYGIQTNKTANNTAAINSLTEAKNKHDGEDAVFQQDTKVMLQHHGDQLEAIAKVMDRVATGVGVQPGAVRK